MARTEITGAQIKDYSVSLSADVAGVLPVASGGTGADFLTLGALLVGNGTGAVQVVAPGTAGNVLVSTGSAWVSSALAGAGDVVSNTSTSVDSEVVLFNGTTGKSVKRATGSGIALLTSGVLSTVTAPSGTIVGTTDSQSLSNKTLADPSLTGTVSVASGGEIQLYRTADRVTNYERFRMLFNSANNYWQLSSESAGTASPRAIRIGSNPNQGIIFWTSITLSAAAANSFLGSSTNQANAVIHTFTNTGFTSSSAMQYGIGVLPTINQSGTAGYTALLVNPTETATGSGTKCLIDAQVGGVSKFTVDNAGSITSATGAVHDFYNTADTSVNYERVRAQWTGNTFQIVGSQGGTGSARAIQLVSGSGTTSVFSLNTGSTSGAISFSSYSAAPGGSQIMAGGQLGQPNGVGSSLVVNPTINQSGTAGYTALLINPTETNVGSGTKRLIDAQVGGSSRFTVDNAGLVNAVGGVQVNGVDVVTTTGVQTLTNKTLTSPTVATIVNTGTLTLPTSTDTLVARATTDTLTNKTISGSSNTLSNIAMTSLSATGTPSSSTYLRGDGSWQTLATGAYNTLVGDGTSTSITVTHNLGTRYVAVSVFDTTTYELVAPDVTFTSDTALTLTFAEAPAAGAYRCVVISGGPALPVNTTVTINAQTGTSYTLALADAGNMITLTNAAAITLTVPTNSTAPFPVGTRIDLSQSGAGQVTVAGASGVTVNATPGLKIAAQYGGATLTKLATDTWLLVGALAA